MPTILSASEITVRYNDRVILDTTTLGIQEGERLGLVGRNGAGKTPFSASSPVCSSPTAAKWRGNATSSSAICRRISCSMRRRT